MEKYSNFLQYKMIRIVVFHLPSLYLITLQKSLEQLFVLRLFILAALGLSCSMRTLSCGKWIQFLDQGSNPGPLHWVQGALASGPQGKSQSRFSKVISLVSFLQKYKKPNKNSYTIIIKNCVLFKINSIDLRTNLSEWPHFQTGLEIDRDSLAGNSLPAACVYWNSAL